MHRRRRAWGNDDRRQRRGLRLTDVNGGIGRGLDPSGQVTGRGTDHWRELIGKDLHLAVVADKLSFSATSSRLLCRGAGYGAGV